MSTTTTRPDAPVTARAGGFDALVRLVFGVREASKATDLALVIARIALAWIFIYYGAGKLFDAFQGPGIHATAAYFANSAHLRPGLFWAWLGGLTEFLGGIAMAVGFLTRLAGIGLFVDMVMAMITVTWATGLNANPGYQVNLALAALALVMVLLGAGRVSVDARVAKALAGGAGRPAS